MAIYPSVSFTICAFLLFKTITAKKTLSFKLVQQDSAPLRRAVTTTGPNAEYEASPNDRMSIFFVKFQIGSTQTTALAAMDTGSPLLWIQCDSCMNCGDTYLKFQPNASSSYKKMHCQSYACYLMDGTCDTEDSCYFVAYYGSATASGYLSTESLYFKNHDGDIEQIPDVVFGCANSVSTEKYPGLFGLGARSTSLAARFLKFSYCLGRLYDDKNEYNRLTLGEDALLLGSSVELEYNHNFYYVKLEGISVGEEEVMLDINPDVFKFQVRSDQHAAGVFVDSGCTNNLLVQPAYEKLIDAVKELIELPFTTNHKGQLCFNGTMGHPRDHFLSFHFYGGATLDMDYASAFGVHDENESCLMFEPSPLNGTSIIGLMAQQYHNFGYDIVARKMYFMRVDCILLYG